MVYSQPIILLTLLLAEASFDFKTSSFFGLFSAARPSSPPRPPLFFSLCTAFHMMKSHFSSPFFLSSLFLVNQPAHYHILYPFRLAFSFSQNTPTKSSSIIFFFFSSPTFNHSSSFSSHSLNSFFCGVNLALDLNKDNK